MVNISVIIPTLNAEHSIGRLLDALNNQTLAPCEIIVIDSESSDRTLEYAQKKGAKVISIARQDFDHGATRNFAAENSLGDYLLFMTQDALPVDNHTICNLFDALNREEGVVAAFARQIAYPHSSKREKLIRTFNYPDESQTKSINDLAHLGIKTYFFSDVCAIYNKEYFFKLNGFESPIATNEDMLMALRIIRAGKKIRYESQAKVYHSHDSSLKEIFKRNYLIGKFLSKYKSEFLSVSANSEGVKMVKHISKQLADNKQWRECFLFWIECAMKFAGNFFGKWN